jgi:putative endopeptidase
MRADAPERKVAEGFTEDQQFFLANAQVWCAKVKEQEMRRRAQVDPHSDPRHRVNGPMSNLPAFAEAFQCAPGAPMNPEETCAVW